MSKSAKKFSDFNLLLEVCQFDEDNNTSNFMYSIPALKTWWEKNKPVEKTKRIIQVGDKVRSFNIKGVVQEIEDGKFGMVSNTFTGFTFDIKDFIWNKKKDRWESKDFHNMKSSKRRKIERQTRKLQAKHNRKSEPQPLVV